MNVSIRLVALVCVVLSLAGGCSSSSNTNAKGDNAVGNPGAKGGGASDYAARYEAAVAMTSLQERDSALTKVAQDAAAAGDAETVKKCLQKMTVLDTRDNTAYSAALALARAGKMDAATEVAKSINVLSRRDEALGKLARGEFGK